MQTEHEIEIRVRYQETDGQGHVHHANYLNYFELGRTEFLRASGHGYDEFEASGLLLVVSEISCRYFLPCRFGDLLKLQTTVTKARGAKVEHRYQLFRGAELLAEGHSTIACIDREGKVRRLPLWMTMRKNTE